ncbi:uncharacterized protein B0I36DRAFT_323770 [Microdochium trichocladiopsis]|uniref:Uncharacterized protein n=1 Tax=Microdochium trichocladiopsis TaxID=1682393 RepID=A0A9P8Y7L9_9PEZI|nr:uncharacterized protein B0I36DRAFT_323770 [Microdochium trichocladiopsis]KAH7031363.1 hypothetical protein B0I36DRAFT_323770 [Microdochium trichocladiopsis]
MTFPAGYHFINIMRGASQCIGEDGPLCQPTTSSALPYWSAMSKQSRPASCHSPEISRSRTPAVVQSGQHVGQSLAWPWSIRFSGTKREGVVSVPNRQPAVSYITPWLNFGEPVHVPSPQGYMRHPRPARQPRTPAQGSVEKWSCRCFPQDLHDRPGIRANLANQGQV